MSLPRLNSFLGIELELGVKIFSLVLAIMALITGVWIEVRNYYYFWVATGPSLAALSAIAFGLAFIALEWSKGRGLLIPAAVAAPIVSILGLIFFILILVKRTNAEAIVIALLYLFKGIFAGFPTNFFFVYTFGVLLESFPDGRLEK